MKPYFISAFALLLLSACQTAPTSKPPEPQASESGEWRPSTLSEQTIAKANAAVKDYQICLNEQAGKRAGEKTDPRRVADEILKVCEERLAGVKTAYDTENVPAAISERYMRKTRSHGAQGLLRYLMSAYAMRVAEEEEAAQAAKSKKNKKKSKTSAE